MDWTTIEAFIRLIGAVTNADDLADAMSTIVADLGFQYFALAHHVDLSITGATAIRLHNYPSRWADYYEANGLGVSDPVHRASHKTSIGFRWSRIPFLVPLTPRDWQMLDRGRAEGIGDGFTVPANVPGETFGSCSFANDERRPIDEAKLPLAQLVGVARRRRSASALGSRARARPGQAGGTLSGAPRATAALPAPAHLARARAGCAPAGVCAARRAAGDPGRHHPLGGGLFTKFGPQSASRRSARDRAAARAPSPVCRRRATDPARPRRLARGARHAGSRRARKCLRN